MAQSNRLGLPLLDAAQAQKHVTHNEALAGLDALVQLSVSTRRLTSPPANPAEGARLLVGTGASAAFAGRDGAIAAFDNGGWAFFTPRAGWRVHIADENALLLFDGTQWADIGLAIRMLQNLTGLGIGTASDATNTFAAKTNAGLFAARSPAEGGTGDIRVLLNKSAAASTASSLYQTNFSGRAEAGLAGDDNFRIKVSADGAVWRDGLLINAQTGVVSFPSGTAGGIASLRSGAGAPTGTAGPGDFWVDTLNSRLYGPYAGSAWPTSFVSLVGATGAAGSSGTRCLTTSGTPSPLIGNNGDTCLDESNRVLYGPKRNGVWDLATQLGAAIPQPAPTIVDFTTGTMPSGFSVTRAAATNGGSVTNAEYTDAAGTGYQTFAANAGIMKAGKGVGAFPYSTNLLLNSTAPATQTVTLATGTYILWGNGTGSITSAAGTAAGSGFGALSSLQGNYQTIVITTAGTVTITPSGAAPAVNWFQLENPLAGSATATAAPTPLIVTGSAASTRSTDNIQVTDATLKAAIANLAAGTVVVETAGFATAAAGILTFNGSGNPISTASATTYQYYDGPGYATAPIGLDTFRARIRSGIAWSGSTLTFGAGSGPMQAKSFAYNAGTAITAIYLGSQTGNGQVINGWISKLEVTTSRLTDAQLAANLNLLPAKASSFYNFTTGAASLPLWTSAKQRAAAGGANAKVLVLSDSTGAGQGDNGGSTALKSLAWPTLLSSALNAGVSKSNVTSFFGSQVAVAIGFTAPSNYNPALAFAGSWSLYGSTLGGDVLAGASGSKLSLTSGPATDSAWVILAAGSGYGTTTIDVDGGTALATVNSNATAAVTKTVVTFARGANRTLNLTASGGAQHVIGAWMFDGTNREIAVFNGSRSGWKASDATGAAGGGGPENSPLQVVDQLQPDLTIICLTINDWANAVSVSSWQTSMQTLITKAKATGDVILMSGVPSNITTTTQANQQAFVTALKSLAASNGVPMLDIWTRWYGAGAGWSSNKALGWMYDDLHPSATGYADIANEVFAMLRAN